MSNRIVAPARQAGIRFLGSLKGLQIRALVGPKHCCAVADGRRGKDDRKQNTLAPLIHTFKAFSKHSGRTKYSPFVSKLSKSSEECLSPQKTQKAATFFI